MATSDVSKTIGRASVTQILADLLVLGHDNQLPDWADVRTDAECYAISLDLRSYEDLIAWDEALAGEGQYATSTRTKSFTFHRTRIPNRKGWEIWLRADADNAPPPSGLIQADADVLRTVA